MAEFNLNFSKISEMVDKIIGMEGKTDKCDTTKEFNELSKLLANTEKTEDQEYIMGFMVEYTTDRSQAVVTTEKIKETDNTSETSESDNQISWAELENETLEDWINQIEYCLNYRNTENNAYDKTNLQDMLFLDEVSNLQNMLSDDGKMRLDSVKGKLDELLSHDWTTSKDDIDGLFTSSEFAYIVDDTIAARMDNVLGLDKKMFLS